VPNQGPIRDDLGDYVPQRGRLNWWYPEDYKNLTWEDVWRGLQDPSARARVWRYFLYRETLNPLGSRDFDFYVRADLARGVSSPGDGVSPAVVAPAQAVAEMYEGGITLFGRAATGGSVLREPRGIEVGPDGLLYVADAAGHKITVFNPDGSIAREWGRKGTADGTFNEPWGVAVAPNGDVFVADTWNHRIQKFDSTGRLLAKWGSFVDASGASGSHPGSFWGPRDIAIAPNGNVLVSDTGNKRVQVFDSDGRFLTMFGGNGSAPGEFSEPVGIAVDADGNVYVADTWNQRIQKFDSAYRPVEQFPVPAWESRSVVNKPYLSVDDEGNIVYSEPERHRVVVAGPSGEQVAAIGALGASPGSFNNPTGVAIGPSGQLFVADGRNSRIVRYQTWR
jgi:sugar lactone lactonase YvrE